MQAWISPDAAGVQTLRWEPQALPEPSPGEVRVRIHAASLNFPDLLILQGKYQMRPPLPFVPGAEFSGIVEAVGAGVRHLHAGTRVAGFSGTGAFATHACISAALLLPLPDGFDLDMAAAFICTYATSQHALMDRGQLQAGETVLVLGAAGGVGTAAIQLAKAAGASVIAAASSAGKCQRCLDIGADHVIDLSSQDLRTTLKELTGGRGPDLIYDPVGGELSEAAFRSIAWRGRHLVVGFAQGQIPALPLNLCLLKGASLVGVFWGEFAKREPQRNAVMLGDLVHLHLDGRITPVIDQRFSMRELPAAFERMQSRQVTGKVLLLNDH
ncbi:NADPH:quinone oxidoreductase family protein [Mitsuaria sp. WAJ17]|uniref:NADPH:quinone oxidoreductase family protein n=1 Tax=Mitsuaria sp. WAJ17 TaxID=2761452 RepID=UPI0015FEEC93|nr:NADPH:quinone oxidoreductase family protein [Mitsuaria sp. WAJ17]MBB2485579.1 NADPH:quinone oxidoreductase family protein [Mitsuaria sp. WAJ17]